MSRGQRVAVGGENAFDPLPATIYPSQTTNRVTWVTPHAPLGDQDAQRPLFRVFFAG